MIKETNADEVRDRFLTNHHQVIQSLNNFDTEVVEHSEEWVREEGGGGKTYAFSLGKFLEKGGINFSDVRGSELPPSAIKERPELTGSPFRAIGVSVVFHPKNPHVPTAHANIRFFSSTDGKGHDIWWFGGGFDLTPYYPILEDVIFWHKKAKELCDNFDKELYPSLKNSAMIISTFLIAKRPEVSVASFLMTSGWLILIPLLNFVKK